MFYHVNNSNLWSMLSIFVNLDVMLVKRQMKSTDLAQITVITTAIFSILKSGKAKAVRFSNLEAICKALDCQPADILKYIAD